MDERTKKSTGGKRASAAPDRKASREPVTALNLPRAELSPAMEAYFKKCDEKIGFVPNVLEAYAFDMAKLRSLCPDVQRPDARAIGSDKA
jgi:hypothetical protein